MQGTATRQGTTIGTALGGERTAAVVITLDDGALLEGLGRLRTVVGSHLVGGGCEVVVDIAGVRRLSSATVAALLWTKRHCRSRGGHVVVRGPSEDSLNMLRRAGLSDVFEIQLTSDATTGRRRG